MIGPNTFSPSVSSTTFQNVPGISDLLSEVSIEAMHFTNFFLKFKFNLQVKRVFFLLNAAFAMAIPDLI